MYSAFSTKLIHDYELIMRAKTRDHSYKLPEGTKIIDILTELADSTYLIDSIALFLGPSMNSEELSMIDDDIVSILCTNLEVRKLLRWVNKNILREFVSNPSNWKTREVRIRIATGMLNNLFMKEKIAEHYAHLIHDNFTGNLLDLQDDLLNESLPFLRKRGVVSLPCPRNPSQLLLLGKTSVRFRLKYKVL